MTPDRLVDFIPSVLEQLSPPPTLENPGNAADLCRWIDKLTRRNPDNPQTGIRNPLWPLPPRIAATHYTLSQAPQVPQLHIPAEIPVTFCNYPGHNFRGDPLPALEHSERVAGHVIAANGEVAFSRTDFELPGPFRFLWQRFYRQSAADTAHGLGNGWRHTLSECLLLPEVTGDAEQRVMLYTAEGRSIAFNLPAIGHASFNRCERLYLLRQSLHSFRIGGFATADRIFRADGTGNSVPLCEIRDAFGNTLSVDYRSGQPHRIITSWGRTLECLYDGKQLTRIINTQAPEEAPLCCYSFDDEQRLVSAETSNKQKERYNYDREQLVSLSSSTGTIRFSYDRIGRCHQLQDNALELQLQWQASRRQCTLTSVDQQDIHWQFDERGDMIRKQHAQRETRYLYDHYRNLCLQQDEDGERTLLRHDEFGRLLRRTCNGIHQRFVYDPRGQLRAAVTSEKNTENVYWLFDFDDKSKPSAITDPAGHVWKCEYDERGQLRQLTDPESGRTTLQWDGQSQLQELKRGERVFRFDYDAVGRLTACEVDQLPTRGWQYDKHGALIQAEIAGKRYSLAYDEQARACSVSEISRASVEPLLQWQNDECGLVRHIRFADGRPWNLDYDGRGKLSKLSVDDSHFHWHYDRCGRLQEFTDDKGRKREWRYSDAGRISEYRDSDNHWYLDYRTDGALEQIRNNNGQHCRFHFDDHGRLVQASNNYCHQRFRYDNRDRLVAEHHDITIDNRRESLSIHHDYDARGWLRASGSDSINVAYIFAASGALYGMDANGGMLLRSESSHSLAEADGEFASEQWTLGEHRLTRHYAHGALAHIGFGEELQWQTRSHEIEFQPDFLVTRTESTSPGHCDQRGNIVSEIRNDSGERLRYDYQFDGWGLMHSAECGDFSIYFRYDPFGRRLAKSSSHRRSRRQRRVSSYWSSLGLWHETARLDDSRTIAHFLHHPLLQIPLARLTHISEQTREEGKNTREQRHFFLADDGGQMLALLDANAAESAPLWHQRQEVSAGQRGPGAFRGSDGILDGETRLIYRNFSYWHDTGDHSTPVPLDVGQHRLVVGAHTPSFTVADEFAELDSSAIQNDARNNASDNAGDNDSVTTPASHPKI